MYITLHCSHQSFVTMYCSRRPTVSSPLLLLLLVLYHSQISSCLSVERVLDQDRGDGGAEEVQLPALERFTPAQLAAIAAGAGALLPFPGNHNNEVLKLPEVRDGNSAVLPKGRGDEHDGHGEVAARHGNHGQEAPPSGRHRDHGKGEQPAAGRHELHEGDKLPGTVHRRSKSHVKSKILSWLFFPVERNDPPTTAAARILYAEGEGKSGHKGHSLVKRWAFRTADEPLCKQFPGHTMCKPKVGPACKESTNGKGFTEAEKKEMVKLSNDVRRKVKNIDVSKRDRDISSQMSMHDFSSPARAKLDGQGRPTWLSSPGIPTSPWWPRDTQTSASLLTTKASRGKDITTICNCQIGIYNFFILTGSCLSRRRLARTCGTAPRAARTTLRRCPSRRRWTCGMQRSANTMPSRPGTTQTTLRAT
jgi:hypothetical protein